MKRFAGLLLIIFTLSLLIAGCGGGGKKVHRIAGLSPEKVVTTFHDRAKQQNYAEAALYVAPTTLAAVKGVGGFLRDDLGLTDVLNSNILATEVVEKGNYAVVGVVFQNGVNSTKITTKAVGLEKIDGEWYILDTNSIFRNAKYQILQGLINSVL